MSLIHIAQAALLALGLWALLRPRGANPGPADAEEGGGGGGVRRHPHARPPRDRPDPRRRGPHGGHGRRPPAPERIRSVTARGRAFSRH